MGFTQFLQSLLNRRRVRNSYHFRLTIDFQSLIGQFSFSGKRWRPAGGTPFERRHWSISVLFPGAASNLEDAARTL